MTSVTWRDIAIRMCNDALHEFVVPPLVYVTRLAACFALLVVIGHLPSICIWYVKNVGWTPTTDMIAALGLATSYATALAVIALCACAIRGEFDSVYLTIVLTSSVAMSAAIGPFVPATFRTSPTVPIYMFNGVAVVMMVWLAVTAVYGVVLLAILIRWEFMDYVDSIRHELTCKRK